MKCLRFLLLPILMMVGIIANAQTFEVFKNGVVFKTFSISEVDSVVYKPTLPTNYVLIGSISLKGDVTDPLAVRNNITPDDIERNIDNGLLFEKEYTQVLSTVKKATNQDGYVDYEFSGTPKYQVADGTQSYTYQVVLVPESLNDYIGVWGADNFGASFDKPQTNKASLTGEQSITYNDKTYKVYGYYLKTKPKVDYNITIIKK